LRIGRAESRSSTWLQLGRGDSLKNLLIFDHSFYWATIWRSSPSLPERGASTWWWFVRLTRQITSRSHRRPF
jgi:hypothetical protein